jgi:hypothetical protein
MSEKMGWVRIFPPKDEAYNQGALTRIYTADLALVGEAAAGQILEVPVGHGYLASAVSVDGRALGIPERFDVAPTDQPREVNLKPRPSADRPQGDPETRSFVAKIAMPRLLSQQVVAFPIGVASFHAIAEIQRYEQPSDRPEERFCLVFPGPRGGCRYAVIPFDRKYGSWIVPRTRWSPAKTPGYFLPDFEFGTSTLEALQGALRHQQPMLARRLASSSVTDLAEEAVSDKLESALAAILGGLLLLQEAPERLPKIEPWTRILFERFPCFPDALPLRVELLAKLGRHRESQDLLRRLPERGTPWTRRGLRVLTERLQFYNLLNHGSDDDTFNLTQWAEGLLAMAHPACVFCVFEKGAVNRLPGEGEAQRGLA